MNKCLVILSGGVGERFKNSIPKQYYENNDGNTIFSLSIKPFINKGIDDLVIVSNPKFKNLIIKETENLGFKRINFALPGTNRQESFDNAIKFIRNNLYEEGQIFIQEAVRPFVSNEIIEDLINANSSHLTVAPGINPPVLYGDFNEAEMKSNHLIPKNKIIELQLPKRHDLKSYLKYRDISKIPSSNIIDESEIFTTNGISIHIIKGSFSNVKITFPNHRILLNSFYNK